jgi:hypothetical protein
MRGALLGLGELLHPLLQSVSPSRTGRCKGPELGLDNVPCQPKPVKNSQTFKGAMRR